MKIVLGADHLGFNLKAMIKTLLESNGYKVGDIGCFDDGQMCDYVDYAECVAKLVSKGVYERGVLICGTGIGMSIAANKITGVRAALCSCTLTAELSRRHNDANVLCLSHNHEQALRIVTAWLETEFEGGRHQARLDKIARLEAR